MPNLSLIFIVILSFAFLYYILLYNNNHKFIILQSTNPTSPINSNTSKELITISNSNSLNTNNKQLIRNYDLRKIYDPLVDPSQRTTVDQIPSPLFNSIINIPTQGYPDSYHRVGLLIATDYNNSNLHPSHKKIIPPKNLTNIYDIPSEQSTKSYYKQKYNVEGFANFDDNNILELIGKKYSNNWYKYYTSISMGNKIIKIEVNNKNKRELYDNDVVFIPELNKYYNVKLDDVNMIEYNPYFL